MRTRKNVSVRSRSNWNLEMLVFKEREKADYPRKKNSLGARDRARENPQQTSNSAHIWRRTPGFEPRPHWWEASALTLDAPRGVATAERQ